MIKPTVGRVVWFRHFQGDPAFAKNDKDQPFAAIVTYVWSNRKVNLMVMDHNGMSWPRTGVKLVQSDDHVELMPERGQEFAEWMPFQLGQAAATQQAENINKKNPASADLKAPASNSELDPADSTVISDPKKAGLQAGNDKK